MKEIFLENFLRRKNLGHLQPILEEKKLTSAEVLVKLLDYPMLVKDIIPNDFVSTMIFLDALKELQNIDNLTNETPVLISVPSDPVQINGNQSSVVSPVSSVDDIVQTLDLQVTGETINLQGEDLQVPGQGSIQSVIIVNSSDLLQEVQAEVPPSEPLNVHLSKKPRLGDEKIKFQVDDLNLIKELEKCVPGLILLSNFKKTGELTPGDRNLLSEIIIDCIFMKGIRTLGRPDHEKIAQLIADTFNENPDTYYCPGSEGKSQAKGKIFDKYRNRKAELIDAGLMPCRSKVTKVNTESIDEVSSPEVEKSLLFLKHNKSPLDEIKQHWVVTAKERLKFRQDESQSSTDILTLHPHYKDPRGDVLIEIDFEVLYGKDASQRLLKKFDEVFVSLIKTYQSNLKDKALKEKLELLKSDSIHDENAIVLHKLNIILGFMPPRGRTACNQKFTLAESWNSLISCIKEDEQLEERITEREQYEGAKKVLQAKSSRKKSSDTETKVVNLPPFVVAVAPSDTIVSNSFVIFNKTRYQFTSLLKAVDVCFKIFQVFNLKYPTESEQFWIFIQKYIFDITTPYDKKIPQISTIINSLNKNKK